jgi:hypothetical protein
VGIADLPDKLETRTNEAIASIKVSAKTTMDEANAALTSGPARPPHLRAAAPACPRTLRSAPTSPLPRVQGRHRHQERQHRSPHLAHHAGE